MNSEAEQTTVQVATESDSCLLPEEATEAPAANRYNERGKQNTRLNTQLEGGTLSGQERDLRC